METLDDLSILPAETLNPIKAMIKTAADYERRKQAGKAEKEGRPKGE